MNRSTKVLIIACVVILAIVFSVALSMPVRAASSVQEMISSAPSGSTITIPAGKYTENIAIDHPLTIHGTGVTITAADASKPVVTISGSGVHIDGFKLTGGWAGVYLPAASGNQITNCNLANNGYGVYGDYASGNTISGNIMTGEYGSSTALGDGAFLNHGDGNIITSNTLSNNNAFGISLYSSSNNKISDNKISDNVLIGIRLGPGASNNVVFANTVSGNGANPSARAVDFPPCGILCIGEGNHIYENQFSNQPTQIIGTYIHTEATPTPTALPPLTTTITPKSVSTTVPTTPQIQVPLVSTAADNSNGWISIIFIAIAILIITVFAAIYIYYKNGYNGNGK